ncbi:uncharacterized protein PRCAT00005667001 [Priceomyces carsonii]|uniref:uncharacterized protein n=1 Tax=Priceomyces carsonii TaxID=28549 RepID=UPI002ED9C701|nr:unnamed protein product [Priceomyces carsonii]
MTGLNYSYSYRSHQSLNFCDHRGLYKSDQILNTKIFNKGQGWEKKLLFSEDTRKENNLKSSSLTTSLKTICRFDEAFYFLPNNIPQRIFCKETFINELIHNLITDMHVIQPMFQYSKEIMNFQDNTYLRFVFTNFFQFCDQNLNSKILR